MRLTYTVRKNSKRRFKCDGEFTVEVRDGETTVVAETPCFIDYGEEVDPMDFGKMTTLADRGLEGKNERHDERVGKVPGR